MYYLDTPSFVTGHYDGNDCRVHRDNCQVSQVTAVEGRPVRVMVNCNMKKACYESTLCMMAVEEVCKKVMIPFFEQREDGLHCPFRESYFDSGTFGNKVVTKN